MKVGAASITASFDIAAEIGGMSIVATSSTGDKTVTAVEIFAGAIKPATSFARASGITEIIGMARDGGM